MALFVLASKDGWVSIMYTGLDAVGVDQQVFMHSCLIYCIVITPLCDILLCWRNNIGDDGYKAKVAEEKFVYILGKDEIIGGIWYSAIYIYI